MFRNAEIMNWTKDACPIAGQWGRVTTTSGAEFEGSLNIEWGSNPPLLQVEISEGDGPDDEGSGWPGEFAGDIFVKLAAIETVMLLPTCPSFDERPHLRWNA